MIIGHLLVSHPLLECPPFLLIAIQPLHYIFRKRYLLIVSPCLLIIIILVLPEFSLFSNNILIMLSLKEVTSPV